MKKFLIPISFLFFLACSNLEEDLQGTLTDSGLSDAQKVVGQINASYLQLRSFQHSVYQFSLQEHPSDEMAGPTRGPDWNDGGAWRALHLHTWNSTHPRITGTWEQILSGLYYANDALAYNPTSAQKAEATFLSSFYTFMATDLWGQVPYRTPGETVSSTPKVYKRTEAIDIAINQLEAVFNDLPTNKTPTVANQYNAATLLAKMYLNRAVYKATDADGTPQVGPFTFSATDMDKVISYCDKVIAGGYSLQSNYFDNFAPNNSSLSTEALLSSANSTTDGGELRVFYYMTLHYNQNPSGWNGFVALTDLYNKFTPGDKRLGGNSYTGVTDVSGIKPGILVGQQLDQTGANILDRQKAPLSFTQDFDLFNSNEAQGMRVIKYLPDYASKDRPANDFIIFRYADVLLMKAEALARKGDLSSAAAIVDQIRTTRGATALGSVTLSQILDERARELYWEGWRRQDQIRFSTFLNPVQQKPNTSDRSKIIFPIPATAVSTNPNLVQNPGY